MQHFSDEVATVVAGTVRLLMLGNLVALQVLGCEKPVYFSFQKPHSLGQNLTFY